MAIEAAARLPSRWTRTYPPLAFLAVAVLVAAFILPSSLNLPQSNPATVLEYAPVPPEDDEPPPQTDGNLSSLGAGESSTLQEGGGPPPPPPPPPDKGTGSLPTDKRCVGNPPRQTEDPMAPPCVPFFDGDNFGATYQGVTGDIINVLIYLDAGCVHNECPRADDEGSIVDLQRPPRGECPRSYPARPQQPCDYLPFRIARAFRDYFNNRFQTYGRRAHYYAYLTSASTAATRRQDAADHWAALQPFAVIDQATFNGHNQAYDDAMASRGVLVFTQETALPNAVFNKDTNRKKLWGFWPDVEHWAAQYTSYVCTRVNGYPVRRFGNPSGQGSPNGDDRRFGLYYTSDPGEPGLHRFRDLVKAGFEECGLEWVTEATFPRSGFAVDGGDSGQEQAEAVQKFQANDVTTVLWLGGIEGRFTHTADAARYYPEIVLAGDLDGDNNVTARQQARNVWQNAWATSFQLRFDRPEQTPGFRAYKEGDPNATTDESRFANSDYRDHFMLFQAVQVAGPRLHPDTIDEGFHAIPEKQSTDPYIASCFFDPGDYSCVKDATEQWWDPNGIPQGGVTPGESTHATGCWRLVEGGQRYLAWRWPAEETTVFRNDDPCTGYEGFRRLRTG